MAISIRVYPGVYLLIHRLERDQLVVTMRLMLVSHMWFLSISLALRVGRTNLGVVRGTSYKQPNQENIKAEKILALVLTKTNAAFEVVRGTRAIIHFERD